MTRDVQEIFAGLFAVLVLASATGWWMRRRFPSPAVENLNARIRAWWVMIVAGGVALALGRYAVIVLFALISWFALREFVSSDRAGRPGWLYFAAVPAQFMAVAYGWELVVLLLVPLVGFAFGKQRRLGLLLCVYGLSFVAALDRGEWMLYLVLVVQASDVLQYLWGRMIGRHAVAPNISPSKTVEGLVGGVATATAIGTCLHYLTPFGPWGAMVVSFLIASTGFLSGLLLSAIKRQREIKDWGTAIAGHGGVLDRVDSLCLSAPLFYWVVRVFAG
jgi:phosphatidate cytidylyltransferase